MQTLSMQTPCSPQHSSNSTATDLTNPAISPSSSCCSNEPEIIASPQPIFLINLPERESLEHFIIQQTKASTENCLKNHLISEELRSRMIDWMLEVTHKADCSPNTIHYAVKIMDRYLKSTSQSYKMNEMHLIGVTAMMIASKLEDVAVMDANFMFEHVVHEKISLDKIKSMEMDIFKTLKFWLTSPCEAKISEILIPILLENKNNDILKNMLDFADQVATINLFNYEFCTFQPSELAAGSVLYTLEKNIEKGLDFISKISELTKIHESKIKEVYNKIKEHIDTFSEKHMNIKRIYEYNTILSNI